jgi:Flp pilus assembly protein TadD
VSARTLHQEGIAAFSEGRPEAAAELMRAAMRESFDSELLNDLAVVEHELGRRESAEGILRTCLALDPTDEAAAENLASIAGGQGIRAAWRSSETSAVPTKIFPSVPSPACPPPT